MRSKHMLKRRAILRGALGVVVGLPLLDAMLNENGTALAEGGPIPKRFGVWFWGNGSDPDRWTPAALGAGWEPSEMLGGLALVKDYVNVVSGMTLPTLFHLNDPARHNPHVEGAVAILSGGNPVVHPSYTGQENDWDYLTVPAPSIDQIAADHIAGTTPFRSLTLGITPVHTADAGSSNAPGTAVSYISHEDPYLFNPPKMDPSEVFAYLFAGGLGNAGEPDPEKIARANVLDAVMDDASALRMRLGASDRQRLDNHLEAIGELQSRLNSIWQPGEGCMLPTDPGNPASDRARAKAMADLIAMAFACDLTRVVSVEFSSPASHVDYPDIYPSSLLFNGSPISFHEYEHNAGIDDTVRQGLKYFIEVFADFLASLKAIPEGGGNALDNSCIFGTSEVSFGPSHGFENYPMLVAGRAGGALAYPGVHIAEPGQPATRVPLTCLKAVGVPIDAWGQDQLAVSQTVGGIEA